ncbi:MAG: hypothetical protein AAFQ80_03200 [Cyanobacteria bacterium J06621_8]
MPSLALGLNLLNAAKFESFILANAAIPDSYISTEQSIRNEQLLAQTVQCVDYLNCNFQSCDRIGSDVICKMLLTANQDTEITVFPSSRAFDRFGNEYYVSEIAVGNSNSSNTNRTAGVVAKDMLQGIGVKLEVIFKEIPTEIQNFTALDIRLDHRNQKLVFRDIIIN